MSTTQVTKIKWFWAWQDDKQVTWLEAMSGKGLHLTDIRAFGRYVFEVGEPCQVVYRMDFDRSLSKNRDYYHLIEDAGWEHVIGVLGWQYWRKNDGEGRTPELFTDIESKIQKYKRLLVSYFIPTPTLVIVMAMFKRHPGRAPQWVAVSTLVIYGVYFLFLMINFIKIMQRIKELEQKQIL